MLSISEFAEMCHLSPQALRFYHAEQLLVPAAVDERTGHRSYAFEQVERAMLITLLRDTGMSVKLVRQALDEPDTAIALLDRHADEINRQREAQDSAMQAARSVFDAHPSPELRRMPAATVVSRLVHGTPLGRNAQEFQEAEALIEAAAAELTKTLDEAGVTMTSRPWRALALGTPGFRDGSGPSWMVKVAVAADQDVPAELTVEHQEARDELQIFMPGRNTMAKYCTVTVRLLAATMPDEDTVVNLLRVRQEVREDGVLSSAPLERHPAEQGDEPLSAGTTA